MSSSSTVRNRDDKKLPSMNNGSKQSQSCVKKDFSTQIISQLMVNEILQKAEYMQNRNQQVNRFIQDEKLKQSQRFTNKTCNEILQNLLIKHESLSPKIVIQNNLRSPSKTPFSFLNYDQMSEDSDHSHVDIDYVRHQKRLSTKLYNCNKIYIINKKSSKANTIDKNSTIKSIKFNDLSPTPSAFGRSSCKPLIKRVSINHSTLIPRLSVQGKPSRNLLSSSFDHISKQNLLQITKSQVSRSSFHGQKQEQQKSKLIKLQNCSILTNSQKIDQKDFQTNQHISFLRERKQKLENIMKVFEFDDQQKKNTKIQKQNSLKQAKTQTLAQALSKMPSLTTDYFGNKLYYQDPFSKAQKNEQNNSKRQYIKLPRYEIHQEGNLSHNINFKVKDADYKTENVVNQIFSSSCGTPARASTKKITFNMKSVQSSKKTPVVKKNQKTEKNFGLKIPLNEEDKKEDLQKIENQSLENDIDNINPKRTKNPSEVAKSCKSVKKLPKSFRESDQNSTNQKNKQNIFPPEKININGSSNLKNQSYLMPREKNILKTQQSSRSNLHKNSLKQLEALHRQAYASHKQRIHPNLAKIRKTTTKTTEQNDRSKIFEASNETTEMNLFQIENRQLNRHFSDSIESDTNTNK